MIYIQFQGMNIPANDAGVPMVSGLGDSLLDDIRQAFLLGSYTEAITVVTEPTPEPLWTAFNTAMLSDSYWQAWAIPQDLRTAIISAAVIGKGDTFQAAYDTAKAIVPPSGDAIVSWQSLADQYHIPLDA